MSAPAATARRGWEWTGAAAATGFLVAYVGSDLLQLPRSRFVAVHALATLALVGAWVTVTRLHVGRQLATRWKAGLIGGVVVGALLAGQVLDQPVSGRATGLALIGDLAWYGVVYGLADAVLLSVLPVLALYGMRPAKDLQGHGDRLRWAGVALLGSALVTAAYHAGFAEFRGAALVAPLIGNLAMTLAYLLTGSPLAPIVAHVMMHVAAVLHGMESTVQLPPHG